MAFRSKTIRDVDDFLRKLRERYDYALDLDRQDRQEAEDDVVFAAATAYKSGGSAQWTKEAIDQRRTAGRPILTENRLPTFINQVVNDGRQSKPSIRLTPLDGGNKQTADMLQSRIRHIEYESDADIVYDTARKQQVTCGRGFIRISVGYRNWRSTNMEPKLERITNPFSVVFGPGKEYDRCDAEYCFVISNITKEEHERRFGTNTEASRNAFFSGSVSVPAPDWFNQGSGGDLVQIAEYWEKSYKKRQLVRMIDGISASPLRYQDELSDEEQLYIAPGTEPREVEDCTVTQYIVNGCEILDETPYPVPYIPIVPEWGNEEIVDGVQRTYSLIRFAKDPQRLINLYVSNIAELTTQAPKSPYRAPVAAIAGYETLWEKSGIEARAYLPYNQWDDSGREVRPPEREVAEPPIQALVIGYQQAVDALKASMGIFDPSLGARSNETSGIAIQRRQREADNANFHFHDNEARTRKTIGRILLALIQKLDAGAARDVAIRTEQGETQMVPVNTPQPYPDETGRPVQHMIGQGEYDVAISTGPSYTSARQEAFDVYSQIANADPRFMQVAGDILFRTMDAPGSDQIADRYEKLLPPGMAPIKSGEQQPIPPQAQQMIAALQQQIQQAMALAENFHQQIQSKQVENQSKERIVELQEQTKRDIAYAQLQAQDGLAILKADMQRLEQQLGQMHEQRMALQNHVQDQNLTAQQARHDQELQRQDAVHQAMLAPPEPQNGNGNGETDGQGRPPLSNFEQQ